MKPGKMKSGKILLTGVQRATPGGVCSLHFVKYPGYLQTTHRISTACMTASSEPKRLPDIGVAQLYLTEP